MDRLQDVEPNDILDITELSSRYIYGVHGGYIYEVSAHNPRNGLNIRLEGIEVSISVDFIKGQITGASLLILVGMAKFSLFTPSNEIGGYKFNRGRDSRMREVNKWQHQVTTGL